MIVIGRKKLVETSIHLTHKISLLSHTNILLLRKRVEKGKVRSLLIHVVQQAIEE